MSRPLQRVAAVALLALGCLGPAGAAGTTLLEDDFEYFPAKSGTHSVSPPDGSTSVLRKVWDQPMHWHKSNAITVVCDGTAASGDCYLSENFLPGVQGSVELRDHADREPSVWTPPSEEIWIRHFFRFPKEWRWPPRYGGVKLGRLRISDSCKPGEPCIQSYWGLIVQNDPTRLRWTYGYTPDGKRWCCPANEVSARLPGGFQTDRWYCLELHLKQNTRRTPPDGLMEIFIDGEKGGANGMVDTRGDAGPGKFAWTLFNIADNFVGTTGGSAGATAQTPAVHFDGVVLATSRPGCPAAGARP